MLFISFPSAKDPSFVSRYPGRSTIEVVALTPFAWFKKWTDTRWKTPRSRIRSIEISTRGSSEERIGESRSASARKNRLLRAFDSAFDVLIRQLSKRRNLRSGAWYRSGFDLNCLARPDSRNWPLYLTGADATTAGVTGAMMGGVLTASAILRRNLMSVALKIRA